MSKYTRSKSTKRDIEKITLRSMEDFGEKQTLEYLLGMEKTMQQLANREIKGRSFVSKRSNRKYLRYRYVSHVILYRERTKDIFITRILHAKMLPERHL